MALIVDVLHKLQKGKVFTNWIKRIFPCPRAGKLSQILRVRHPKWSIRILLRTIRNIQFSRSVYAIHFCSAQAINWRRYPCPVHGWLNYFIRGRTGRFREFKESCRCRNVFRSAYKVGKVSGLTEEGPIPWLYSRKRNYPTISREDLCSRKLPRPARQKRSSTVSWPNILFPKVCERLRFHCQTFVELA